MFVQMFGVDFCGQEDVRVLPFFTVEARYFSLTLDEVRCFLLTYPQEDIDRLTYK